MLGSRFGSGIEGKQVVDGKKIESTCLAAQDSRPGDLRGTSLETQFPTLEGVLFPHVTSPWGHDGFCGAPAMARRLFAPTCSDLAA